MGHLKETREKSPRPRRAGSVPIENLTLAHGRAEKSTMQLLNGKDEYALTELHTVSDSQVTPEDHRSRPEQYTPSGSVHGSSRHRSPVPTHAGYLGRCRPVAPSISRHNVVISPEEHLGYSNLILDGRLTLVHIQCRK